MTQWPRADRIKDQVGNVKVKPIYHSPCDCKRCGQQTDGPGLCDPCWIDEEGLMSLEAGWDGHKVWGAGA